MDKEKTARDAWKASSKEFKEPDDSEIIRLRSEIRAIRIDRNSDAIKRLQQYDMLVKELRDRGHILNSKDEKLDLIDMIRDNSHYNTTRTYANLMKSTAASLRQAIKDTNKNINPTNNRTVNTIQSLPKTINKIKINVKITQ